MLANWTHGGSWKERSALEFSNLAKWSNWHSSRVRRRLAEHVEEDRVRKFIKEVNGLTALSADVVDSVEDRGNMPLLVK